MAEDKAFIFKYKIKQLTESPFTKAIIAKDEVIASELWDIWKKEQSFEIEDIEIEEIKD